MTPVEVEYLRRYILNQPSFDITKVPGGALEVPEDVPSTYETSHMPNWYLRSETYFGHRVYDLHGNLFTGKNWLKPLSATCIVTGKQIGRASCRERVLRLV